MGTKRRQHDGQYKFRVAMEAAKGSKTLSELGDFRDPACNGIGVCNVND